MTHSTVFVLLLALAACSRPPKAKSGADTSDNVEQEVIIEKTPTGTRKTILTRTKRWVEAPSPPARPADSYPADPLVKYNVDALNSYRSRSGAPPLLYDAAISAFALAGSKQLGDDHTPHAHFAAHIQGATGFGGRSAENQGDPNGVPAMSDDPTASGKRQIDLLLKLMFDEGPGGGHHDNMLNPKYRRVGVGLYSGRGMLYLTNDFSD